MPGKLLRLSDRLMAIAGFIENGSDVADIGADHGYLPVYLAQNGLARHIVASDISLKSHKTAMNTAAIYNVTNRIKFIAAPGLTGIGELEADTIVMAGMGGETISGILADAPWTKHRSVKIIMQPQTKVDKLCSWLYDNDYVLRDATLVRDRGRIYVVMLAGGSSRSTEYNIQDAKLSNIAEADEARHPLDLSSIPNSHMPDIQLLSILAGKGDPLFPGYIEGLIGKARRAAEGLARSGAQGYADASKRLYALETMQNAEW